MSAFDTEQFKKLSQEWERKLAAEGMPEELPAVYVPRNTLGEAYYEQATDFLRAHQFSGRRDRRIWQLHCEGLSIRAVAAKLSIGRRVVERRIRKYRRLMVTRAPS